MSTIQSANATSSSELAGFSALAKPDASDPLIKVIELGQIDRAMWDANVLYGNGRLEEIRIQAKALREKGQEIGYELSVAMLRLDGKKSAFEDMAVEYAVHTGNSPPVWLDAHDKMNNDIGQVEKPRKISIKIESMMAENMIEATIKMESPWPLILDFSEVSKVDVMGVDIFQESLTSRISRSEKTTLTGTEKIVSSISKKLIQSAYEGNAGLWTFCFNIHRLTGNRQGFDDLVSDFVEKTGEDMPQWKDLRDPEEISKFSEIPESSVHKADKSTSAFDVGDSLSKLNKAFLKKIYESQEFKVFSTRQTSRDFSLDFSNMKRWTISDMSGVMGLVRQANNENITLKFINLNEILLSLFKGFSLDKKMVLVVAGGTT